MTWVLKNNSLYSYSEKDEKEIEYFMPALSEKERAMFKYGYELVDLIGEFVIAYDEGKNLSKNLYDRIKEIIDPYSNYKISWTVTYDGALLNENNQMIFMFSYPEGAHESIVAHLPELYSCAQDLIKSYSSTTTKRSKTKEIYERIVREFYRKLY